MLLVAFALASATYPGGLVTDLSMPCTPACTVCHATSGGGAGTVTQPFGVAMKARGLGGGSDSNSLVSALTKMTADGVDSDGDGIIDTDALAQGIDPNTATSFCGNGVLPVYGCFGGTTAVAGLLFFLPGLLWRRAAPRGSR